MSTMDTFGTDFLDADFFATNPFEAAAFHTGFLRPLPSHDAAATGDEVRIISNVEEFDEFISSFSAESGAPAHGHRPEDPWVDGTPPRLPTIELPGSRVRASTSLLRPTESREIIAQLLRPTPPIVVVAGRPGSGRSAIVGEVVAALHEAGSELHLRHSDGDPVELVADYTNVMSGSLDSGRSDAEVLLIDDFDIAAESGSHRNPLQLVSTVTYAHRHAGIRFLLIVDDAALSGLNELSPEFARLTHVITLGALPSTAVTAIVERAAAERAARAGLTVDVDLVAAASAPAGPGDRRHHPGLAIDRIDAAVGRARAAGADSVGVAHLALPVDVGPTSAADLWLTLGTQVRGQNRAVAAVAELLAPALAGLKLRPDRPHGVFLFTGPSGVGKTELAKQVARTVYGDDALIRLDMSEYGTLDDARTKLIGAHKIWKNSTAEGLLTTRVITRPRSVILLDEFEKAHSDLWPLFLQVFDEGRLSDGWGQTAAFHETVIIMTSNLADPAEKFPPEFRNRLSAVVEFAALDPTALREIAELELARTVELLAQRGWQITYDDDVAAYLAGRSADAELGARPLQRTIETDLFRLLGTASTRRIRVVVDDGRLALTPST